MTALGDFSSGDVLTAAELNAIGTWTTYTPEWTATTTNPSVGGGSIVGYYCQLNDLVIGNAWIQAGSGYNRGSGTYRISVPVTGDSGVAGYSAGSAWVYDSSATIARGGLLRCFGDYVQIELIDYTTVNMTEGNPFLFSQNDQIRLHFAYKVA